MTPYLTLCFDDMNRDDFFNSIESNGICLSALANVKEYKDRFFLIEATHLMLFMSFIS